VPEAKKREVRCRFCGRKVPLAEIRRHYLKEHREEYELETRREVQAKIKAVHALAVLENAAFLLPEAARDRYLQAYETVRRIVRAALELEEV